MQRAVVFILGTSFSGSSLLNSLFDAQPETRGLGEAVHLLKKPSEAWCSRCRRAVDQCQLQSRIDADRFYESVFNAYPDANVIVNSSKHWGLCFRYMPVPPEAYRIGVIVLSKSIEEFAHSYAAHQKCSYEHGFEAWTEFYEHLFRCLDDVLAGNPRTEVQQRLVSRITERSIAFVRYRELASRPDSTLRRLAAELELPFCDRYRDRLWSGDTCVIGGNNAIYAQRSDNAAFFQSEHDYLSGKYAGRFGSVFYDDTWSTDAGLIRDAKEYRDANAARIAALEARLGYDTSLAPAGMASP